MPGASTGKLEFDLLCAVARPQPRRDLVRDCLEARPDFDKLLRLAAEHGVRAHLIRSLAASSWESVPERARATLEAFQHRHLLKCLAFAHEVRRLAERLDRGGIRFVTFKGVALATSLYGDPAAREFEDIDILVPQQRLVDAEVALGELGYRGAQGDRRFRQAFLAYQRQYSLVNDQTGLAVDLHWAFCGDYVPFPLVAGDAWQDDATVAIGGRDVPTLSGANLALLLAGHGTKEQWRNLGLVVDFAWLIERSPDLDWLALHRQAAGRGCGRSVLLGACLATQLLGVTLPPDLAALVQRHREVAARAPSLIEQLTREVSLPGAHFVDLELCDRRVDRLKAVLRLAFTRTAGDYKAMPLPPSLWGVYRATRPFRLAVKAAVGRI